MLKWAAGLRWQIVTDRGVPALLVFSFRRLARRMPGPRAGFIPFHAGCGENPPTGRVTLTTGEGPRRRLAVPERTGLTWSPMLEVGETAPDFPIDEKRTLYDLLKTHAVVVFFFPRAFTPG